MNYAPGMHTMPIRDYVADPSITPSLSASIASILIERSPAHAYLAHPRFTPSGPEKFSSPPNFGTAVHALVFGGEEIATIDAADWKTKAAREGRDMAIEMGKIPLLAHDMDRARRTGAAAGDVINKLLTLDSRLEQTFIWRDGNTLLRARPDAMSADFRTIVDLKTTGTNARECNRQFFSQGYDMQAAFLEAACDALFPDGRGKRQIFYVFVETEPPFASSILRISESTLMIARKKMRAAINLWADCMKANRWPGYPETPIDSVRPGWEETAWLMRETDDPMIDVSP